MSVIPLRLNGQTFFGRLASVLDKLSDHHGRRGSTSAGVAVKNLRGACIGPADSLSQSFQVFWLRGFLISDRHLFIVDVVNICSDQQ